MAQLRLKRLLSKEIAGIINQFTQTSNVYLSIQDSSGKELLTTPAGEADTSISQFSKHSIEYDGETLGWVIGSDETSIIADVLTQLAAKEMGKKRIARQLLDQYREVNLLYKLSEKLASSLELQEVAETAIDEATRLIEATSGSVALLNKERALIEPVASFGKSFEPESGFRMGEGIAGHVAQTGKAEVVNDVHADARFLPGPAPISSLVCAPLKAKNDVIGVVTLVSATPVTYTAQHLNLLNTLASQAAPAIENALLYEKTVREAKEREARLQQQIQALRIELDDARQEKHVAEITETDYFQQLRSQADNLRKSLED